MIKPFYKSMLTSKAITVEEYGEINIDDLPIKINEHLKGHYEIGWVLDYEKKDYFLSEHGGSNAINFGGKPLGVLETK